MAQCPLCESEMREVSARANPGTLIVLDQCGQCGGIWCDKWELFPIDPDEAQRLDSVDEKLLQDPVKLDQGPLYCPRCKDRLQAFRDPLLPADIRLERCRRCDGIWLNRGEFSHYKQFQKKMREKLGPKKKIQKLVQAYEDPKNWVTTGTRGIFAYPQGEAEAEDLVSKGLSGAFKLILQTLLRLGLGF